MNDSKQAAYTELIRRVKGSYPVWDASEDCSKLRLYWCDDCEEINLWTYWQGRGNLDAKILLVGQDWGCPWSSDYDPTIEQIRKANCGESYDYLNNNSNPTDMNLIRLFRELDYDIRKPCRDLFFTNFVLGYRNKGLSGGYKKSWETYDKEYFKELANIINPRVILCLGRSCFEGVLKAFGVHLSMPLKDYNVFIESNQNPISVTLSTGEPAYIFALSHCGVMGTLNRNRKKNTSLVTQIQDWRKIIPYIKESES